MTWRGGKLLGKILFSLAFAGTFDSVQGNNLASEKSPYLLQHASDPVEWYPWGEEAFRRARAENKPIFLSVGYSTCHWCHVMADESFREPQTAAFLNQHFINVKVDREERPDIDRLYMDYLQALTGRGGWPMNVWLTPEGEPFYAGTYFPSTASHGLPAFSEVATRMAEGWRTEEAQIRAHGAKALAALDLVGGAVSRVSPPDSDFIANAVNSLKSDYDSEWGGFGREAKFPAAAEIRFLFRSSDPEARRIALDTLRSLAAGALRDHVAGGFHRYTADRQWRVPHFEKMLTDQAQLTLAFLEAYQLTRDSFFASVARETLDFVLAGMSHPGGGFYAALPAQSRRTSAASADTEGAAYLWTYDELQAALAPEEFHAVLDIFAIRREGNVSPEFDALGELKGENVLFLGDGGQSFADPAIWESARRKLLASRNLRPPLLPDDKIVTVGNGLIISSLAQAAVVLGEPRYAEAAQKAAALLVAQAGPTGRDLPRFLRQDIPSGQAFAEDYAGLIGGLLDLYEATGHYAHLDGALRLQAAQDALFWDEGGKGYFSTRTEGGHLPLRLKEWRDGAEPSANVLSVQNLLRFARMLDDAASRDRAGELLSLFTPRVEVLPRSFPNLLSSLQLASLPSQQAVFAGDPEDQRLQDLHTELRRGFFPGLVTLYADGAEGQSFLATRSPAFEAMLPIDGKPALYFCENFTCSAPISEQQAIESLFKSAISM